ncbi:hypothetical protein ACE3MZ_06215 [Paenibacillus sp. WLX1005]
MTYSIQGMQWTENRHAIGVGNPIEEHMNDLFMMHTVTQSQTR